jgi:hypothetical protein
MAHFGSAPPVDRTDPTSILDGTVATARVFSGSPQFDADEARAHAAGILDRSGPHPASTRNGLMSTVFATLDCTPRWRERLPEITAPTLVVYGAADPFFPVGNAEGLAVQIPGATLLVLDGVGAELPRRAHARVATAMLAHTAPWPRPGAPLQRRAQATVRGGGQVGHLGLVGVVHAGGDGGLGQGRGEHVADLGALVGVVDLVAADAAADPRLGHALGVADGECSRSR